MPWCLPLLDCCRLWSHSLWGCYWSHCWGNWDLSLVHCYMQTLEYIQWRKNFLHWNASNWVTICDSTLKQQWQESLPATSRGRFLTVARGPSFLRSRGLLRRSVTFCFSRERSFRLGSEAEKTNVHTFQSSLNDLVSLQLSPQRISYCNVKTLKCYILK